MKATAYPLCWPAGWPRTEQGRRDRGAFKTELSQSLRNLQHQLELMGAKQLTLSSNCALGQERPADPGVAAYFVWNGQALCIPCDRWYSVAHNVQAIALTIEAMRGMERWGAKHMIQAMFSGFKALPAPEAPAAWWTVLGVPHNAAAEQVKEAYRQLVKRYHPDAGGDPAAFRRVQAAWEDYEQRRGS